MQTGNMQMVKIKFADSATEAKGFAALARQVRVICFADKSYEIAKSELKNLDDLKINYEVLGEEGFDRAYHALRNPVASKV